LRSQRRKRGLCVGARVDKNKSIPMGFKVAWKKTRKREMREIKSARARSAWGKTPDGSDKKIFPAEDERKDRVGGFRTATGDDMSAP